MRKRVSEKEKYELVERYYKGESATDLCIQTGIARSTFYTWTKLFNTTISKAGYVVNANEFVKLKQHISKQDQIIEVMKRVNCSATAPLHDRLKELVPLRGQYSDRILCEALSVASLVLQHAGRIVKVDKYVHLVEIDNFF